MSEDRAKWIELVEAYDEAAKLTDPDDIEIPAENEEEELRGGNESREIEDPEEVEELDEGDDTHENEHVPKHCADLYRSLKPSMDVLDAKTKNAIRKIVVDRLGE